jgi:hypothetical protein
MMSCMKRLYEWIMNNILITIGELFSFIMYPAILFVALFFIIKYSIISAFKTLKKKNLL